ncbi:MAG: hypothetical protein H6815_03800 [Phycisphaeraceae bacterium]|nr:hypothetical protein [Phycisphaerales bacterium]MCB9859553.1 hypothetical protein [Phycisphaeraceae bacterium]
MPGSVRPADFNNVSPCSNYIGDPDAAVAGHEAQQWWPVLSSLLELLAQTILNDPDNRPAMTRRWERR